MLCWFWIVLHEYKIIYVNYNLTYLIKCVKFFDLNLLIFCYIKNYRPNETRMRKAFIPLSQQLSN